METDQTKNIPVWAPLHDRLKKIAREAGTPLSRVANHLLEIGISSVESGELTYQQGFSAKSETAEEARV